MNFSLSDLDYIRELKETILDKCPVCKGLDLNCQCRKKFEFEISKIKAKIPPLFRDVKECSSSLRETLKRLKQIVEKGTILYFFGNYEKVLRDSFYFVIECLKKNYSCLSYSWSDSLAVIQKGWYDDDVYFNAAKKLLEVDVLHLYNFGYGGGPHYENMVEISFELIMKRLTDKKTMVIASCRPLREVFKESELVDFCVKSFLVIEER